MVEQNIEDLTLLKDLRVHGNIGLSGWNPKQKTFAASDSAYRMLGFPPPKPSSSNNYRLVEKLFHPEDYADIKPKIFAALNNSDISTLDFEMRVRNANDKWRWILTYGQVVERDVEGHPIYVSGVHMDITDSESKEKENRYRNLINASPVGIFVTQPNQPQIIEYMNDKMAELLQVPESSNINGQSARHYLRGRSYLDFIDLHEREMETDFISNNPSKNRQNYPLTFLSLEQKRIETVVNNSLSDWYHGDALYFFVQDVTQNNREKTQLAALITESQEFIYTVSHDLRSPLLTIQTYAEKIARQLNQDALSVDNLKKPTERIIINAKRMQRLLNDLLELSRIGRIDITETDIDISKVADEVREAMRGNIETLGINFSVQRNPPLPKLRANHARVYQLLQNLVENSIKYRGDEAKPQINIGAIHNSEGVILFVRDNGIGISKEHHQRVFGIFNRLDEKIEGIGVGLTIVKRIVESLDGKVWLESPEDGQNKGTTFFIHFPKSRIIQTR